MKGHDVRGLSLGWRTALRRRGGETGAALRMATNLQSGEAAEVFSGLCHPEESATAGPEGLLCQEGELLHVLIVPQFLPRWLLSR